MRHITNAMVSGTALTATMLLGSWAVAQGNRPPNAGTDPPPSVEPANSAHAPATGRPDFVQPGGPPGPTPPGNAPPAERGPDLTVPPIGPPPPFSVSPS